MKKSKSIASAMLLVSAVMAFALMVLTPIVAGDSVTDAWNGFVSYGWLATLGCIVVAIIVWVIWGDTEYGNLAQGGAMVLVIVGFAAGLGVGVVTEDGGGGQISTVEPEFTATANAANNTTHCTLGVNTYTWAVLYDISDAAISTGEATTLNITVRRTDNFADNYYTNIYVDEDTVPMISNAGVPVSLIALSGTQPRVTWTDADGNANTNQWELERIPEADAAGAQDAETVTCSIYLSDTAIGAMVTNSESVVSFNIVAFTETTDSTGQPISYSNPQTIPVTIVVSSQA